MTARTLLLLALSVVSGCSVTAQEIYRHIILPEQKSIDYRDISALPPEVIAQSEPPWTVAEMPPKSAAWQLSLDDAVRIALENAKVIRVLAGFGAVSSGQTIYDAAISNTAIDQNQARFDPVFSHNTTLNHNDPPVTGFDPKNPGKVRFLPSQSDDVATQIGLTQTNLHGGQTSIQYNRTLTHFEAQGLPLNPQARSAFEVTYTQPLLQGCGFKLNNAPIAIARLNTEQTFFQYKDGVQELVRGVIEAYWALVQARVTLWARDIQVQQSEGAFKREQARHKTGFVDVGTAAQTRVTYNQFRANRIAAQADVLAREGALRNLLYLPPNDCRQIVPSSTPVSQKLPHDWKELVQLAEQRRPDIVSAKISLEVDHVQLLQAKNLTLPKLDAFALYRCNGLSGGTPDGDRLSSGLGQFTDWTLGLSFQVPLGLRQGRAQVRQQELIIARDRANLEQQMHAAIHELANSVRELDGAYEQYLAFKETRSAADVNLRVQNEKFRAGQTIYLNVLQALNDWGNAVQAEALQLLSYNVALATLERRTGTILETHGLVFAEERFCAPGLNGGPDHYPFAQRPTGGTPRYPATTSPSENAFNLQNPTRRDRRTKEPEDAPEPKNAAREANRKGG